MDSTHWHTGNTSRGDEGRQEIRILKGISHPLTRRLSSGHVTASVFLTFFSGSCYLRCTSVLLQSGWRYAFLCGHEDSLSCHMQCLNPALKERRRAGALMCERYTGSLDRGFILEGVWKVSRNQIRRWWVQQNNIKTVFATIWLKRKRICNLPFSFLAEPREENILLLKSLFKWRSFLLLWCHSKYPQRQCHRCVWRRVSVLECLWFFSRFLPLLTNSIRVTQSSVTWNPPPPHNGLLMIIDGMPVWPHLSKASTQRGTSTLSFSFCHY